MIFFKPCSHHVHPCFLRAQGDLRSGEKSSAAPAAAASAAGVESTTLEAASDIHEMLEVRGILAGDFDAATDNLSSGRRRREQQRQRRQSDTSYGGIDVNGNDGVLVAGSERRSPRRPPLGPQPVSAEAAAELEPEPLRASPLVAGLEVTLEDNHNFGELMKPSVAAAGTGTIMTGTGTRTETGARELKSFFWKRGLIPGEKFEPNVVHGAVDFGEVGMLAEVYDEVEPGRKKVKRGSSRGRCFEDPRDGAKRCRANVYFMGISKCGELLVAVVVGKVAVG